MFSFYVRPRPLVESDHIHERVAYEVGAFNK